MGDGSSFGASRFDTKGKGRATPQNGDILALDLGAAEEGTGTQHGDAFMQMQLVEQQVREPLRSRVTALAELSPNAPGQLHSNPFYGYRIYRVNYRRTWPDLHAAGSDGRRATRDRAAHRCGHS